MKTYFRTVHLIEQAAKKQFFTIFLLSLFVGVLQGLQVKFNIMILTAIQNMMDGGKDYFVLILPFIAYTIISPSYYLYTPADAYLRSLLLQKFRIKLLKKVYSKVLSTELSTFEDNKFYNDVYKAEENAYNQNILTIVDSIIYIPLLCSALVSIFSIIGSYNLWLMFLAAITMIPYFISNYLRGKEYFILHNNQADQLRITEYLWKIICEKNTNRDMRVFGTNEYMYDKYNKCLTKTTQEVWNYEKKQVIRGSILDSCRPVGLGIGIICASYMAYKGSITIAVFSSMMTAYATVQEHAEELILKLTGVANSIPFIANYFRLIDTSNEIVQGEKILSNPIESIQFKNVCYRYPYCKEDTIKKLNVTIHSNESISILGVNGAGKSTFSKLLLGLYTPTSGDILYNGVSIFKLNREKLFQKVSAVFQDFTKYQMTVRENIGFGMPEKIDDKDYIEKYVKTQDYLNFTEDLQEGLDTVLSREFGGRDISGGQWQKIAIARGNIKKSDLIVLDEPTSSLDPMAEADIFRTFRNISKDKISLIVSHRIGAARLSDRILVMDDGRIVEDGSHIELMNLEGIYKELYELQYSWYK